MRNRTLIAVALSLLSIVTPLAAYCAPKVESETQRSSLTGSSLSASQKQSLYFNEKAVEAIKRKDFAAAEDLLKRALDADAQNITAAYNLASVSLTLNKSAEAIKLLKTYLSKTPEDSGLNARLGDALFEGKDIPGAIAAYEKALKLEPKLPGIRTKLGTLYTLSKRLGDAEKMLLAAIEEDPQNGVTLANLSALFLANGKADEAISTAKRALQVNPSSKVYITMGSAYEKLKDQKNALIAYQRALDLGDKTPELGAKISELTASKQETRG